MKLHSLVLHKVAIQALAFSSDGEFLASLGSQDDNALAVWETGSGRAVCGTPAGSYSALAVAWLHGRNDRIVTCGQYNIRSWDFNYDRRRCTPEDFKVGSVKRVYTCLTVDAANATIFAGSSTGDVLAFATASGSLQAQSSHRFSLGVLSLALVGDSLLVGTGDGALVRLGAATLAVRKAAELMGGVTSIAVAADEGSAFCGTASGTIYGVNLATLDVQLRGTAPSQPVTDLIFPAGTSELFITSAGSDIRVWHAVQRRELLRIQVPNQVCLCLAINRAGSTIASGWDDGKVRAFSPETGKLLFTIPDAHMEAVSVRGAHSRGGTRPPPVRPPLTRSPSTPPPHTSPRAQAISFTHAGSKLVTGGRDGRVRTWALGARSQTLELSFKEHKKEVTSVTVSANDEEALSSSTDGSCVVWNLRRGTRTNALFASSVFRGIAYHPDESQLITVGSDRKIGYWDTADCTAIRLMDGSTEEVRAARHEARANRTRPSPSPLVVPPARPQIMSVDIDADGKTLATGGADKLVKLWLYDEGDLVATGAGHSGTITKVKVSHDRRIIVSVGAEGAIFIWKCPAV